MLDQADAFANLCKSLQDPTTYSDRPTKVELAETHISCVFLTERFAYKLKKPVCFDFLDFSTLEARRRACLDEVRLNRRLAYDVYLGVAPVYLRGDQRFALGECREPELEMLRSEHTEEVVDWLVVMRRLPADRTLTALLQRGVLSAVDVDRVAARLADFYRAAPSLAIEPTEYAAQVVAHVRGNLRELTSDLPHWPAGLIERVHAAQLAFVELEPRLLIERAGNGRIVEGHGDLRPEHIYCLASGPEIIDCIEFQPEFRRLDGADELAFLAMECKLLDAAWIGERMLDAYDRAVGDAPSDRLWRFYQAYRACVRAKVAALRARQQSAQGAIDSRQTAIKYLQAADATLAGLAAPILLAVGGISGSGKSTLARALAERLGAEVIATDRIRRELFGESAVAAPWQSGVYGPTHRAAVYETAFERSDAALKDARSAILDATFLEPAMRRRALAVAPSIAARRLLVECACPIDEAKRRLSDRQSRGPSESDASTETIDRQVASREPWREGNVCIVDATASLAEQVEGVLGRLRQTEPSASAVRRAGDA